MEPPEQITVPPAPEAKAEIKVPEGHKQCPICGQIKPLDRANWWIRKGEEEPYINKCKDCYNLAYYNSPNHSKGKEAFLKRLEARDKAKKEAMIKEEKQKARARKRRRRQGSPN